MKHTFSVEIREAVEGRPMLTGLILQEGRAARSRREIFAPNSLTWPESGIEIKAVHLGPTEVRAHPVRGRNGEITISAPANDALQQAVGAGKTQMSVEFVSLREETGASGIREIQSAYCTGAALVFDGEYGQTRAEIRNKRRSSWWR